MAKTDMRGIYTLTFSQGQKEIYTITNDDDSIWLWDYIHTTLAQQEGNPLKSIAGKGIPDG